MRTVIALVLFLAGLGLCLYGLAGAVMPIAGLYKAALDDPLAEPAPGNDEKAVAGRAWDSALLGMVGVVPLAIGSTMLSMGVWRRLRPGLQK